MTNAQIFINKKYPTKESKEKATKLIVNKQNLKGHLDLSDFINLITLNCSSNQLTSLDISKNTQLVDLDCSQNKLTNLNVNNCLNIVDLDCSQNKLTNLNVNDCLNIININVHCNQLDNISIVKNENLEYLNLLDNNISSTDLSYFSHFINIKTLFIGNTDDDRIKDGIYNKFHGNLKPLKNLIKLENLSINNTDIESGLEYLPDSIKNFRCLADKISDAKVRKIYEQLVPFSIDNFDTLQGRYNLRGWRENWKLAKEVEKLTNENELTQLEREESDLVMRRNEVEIQKVQLEKEVKMLQEQKDDLNNESRKIKDNYQRTEQKLMEKEKQLENYTVGKLMEKEKLQKEANDDLLNKEKEKKELEEKLEKTNKELKNKEEESENLQSQMVEINSMIKSIQTNKMNLKNLKEKLKNRIRETKSSTASYRRQENELKERVKSEEKKVQNQLLKAKKTQEQLEKAEKDEKSLEEEKSRLQDLLKQLERDEKTTHEKLSGLDAQLKKKDDDINILQQENEHHIKELMRKNEEALQKEELLEKLQKNEENSKYKLAVLESQLGEKDASINKLQQQSKQKIDGLKGQLENSNDKLATLESRLKEKDSRLQNEFNNLKKDLVKIQLQTKKTKLKEIYDIIKNNVGKRGRRSLEELLEIQKKIILNNDNSASERLEEIKQDLIDDFNSEDDIQNLENLLKLQLDIIRLNLNLTIEPDFKNLNNILEQDEKNYIQNPEEIFLPESQLLYSYSQEQEADINKITQAQNNGKINIIKQNQVTDRKRVGNKYISNISSATLLVNNSKIKVVIKELQCDNLELLEKELNNWIKVYRHLNVIKFFGILKDEQKNFLIIPFANKGNLRDYLKNKKLPSIDKKIEVAMNIINGIKYLHENDIIHGNIHSKNILLFDETAKISDLPLPPSTSEAMYFEDKDLFDNIGYTDPDSLLNEDFKKNKSMDIYSLGSLLWEIMNERVPLEDHQEDGILKLVLMIKDEGYREKDISDNPNIPNEYINLYENCWDGNSSTRPKIQEVYERMSGMSSMVKNPIS